MMSGVKVIIVTGASRGIGRAICNYLLKQSPNCNVLATARTHAALQDLEMRHKGRVAVLVGDMGDTSFGQKIVDHALQRWGRIDGLIVNHGTLDPIDRIRDVHIQQWKRAFDVNVFGVVGLLQAALAPLREAKGAILLTSSGAAVKGTAAWGAYNASKAVLNSLARTISTEEPDVTIVAIRPGVVDTEMQDVLKDQHYSKMDKDEVDRFVQMREQGNMLRPEQPGNVMARLALKPPDGISGEFLNWNDDKLKEYQDG